MPNKKQVIRFKTEVKTSMAEFLNAVQSNLGLDKEHKIKLITEMPHFKQKDVDTMMSILNAETIKMDKLYEHNASDIELLRWHRHSEWPSIVNCFEFEDLNLH